MPENQSNSTVLDKGETTHQPKPVMLTEQRLARYRIEGNRK